MLLSPGQSVVVGCEVEHVLHLREDGGGFNGDGGSGGWGTLTRNVLKTIEQHKQVHHCTMGIARVIRHCT